MAGSIRSTGDSGATPGLDGAWLTWQVALVDTGHFISETSMLTDPQCPDEGMHPAIPPPKTVEEVPEGALVPLRS